MAEADKSLDRAHQGIAQERQEREAQLTKQAADTAAAIAGVRSRVEDVAVGTLSVSMFGVCWLAVGVVPVNRGAGTGPLGASTALVGGACHRVR